MSRPKRKMEEIGEQVLSAAVGDVVGRTMSAAVGRYHTHASVDDQLRRLKIMVISLHAILEQAEGVHIRSWWLRRWLWRLRDSALDGDEVIRLFQQRRAAEEAAATTTRQAGNGTRLWNAARRMFQSAKSLLFPSAGGGEMDRLSRTLERVEMDFTTTTDFIILLRIEIRRSMPQPWDLIPFPLRVTQEQLPERDFNNTSEEYSMRHCGRGRLSSHTGLSVVEEQYANISQDDEDGSGQSSADTTLLSVVEEQSSNFSQDDQGWLGRSSYVVGKQSANVGQDDEGGRGRLSADTTLSVVEEQYTNADASQHDHRGGRGAAVLWGTRMVHLSLSATLDDGTDFSGHDFFYVSHGDYVARMIKFGLLIVKENIGRALVRLIYMAGGRAPLNTGIS